MKRFLLLLALIAPSIVNGQTAQVRPALASVNAEAAKVQAPELWNFRLGLTVQEMQQRYPAMAVGQTDEFGITPGILSASVNNRYQSNMAGLNHVALAFVDGRLAHYSASLISQTYYLDIQSYAARMSTSLNLPNAWQHSNKLPGALMLDCATFEVFVFTHPQPGLGMTDTAALNKVLQRWKGNIRTADRIPFSYF